MSDPSENTLARPIPEHFADYRAFLRAMIAHLKATRPEFSYRYFSRQAGFSSPNFLKLVAEGQRNLSLASVPKFAKGLGLDEHEREVFELLVRLGSAQNDAERNRCFQRLRRLRGIDPVARVEEDQFDLYSAWYTVVIRELAGLAPFRDASTWLARRVRPAVRPREARRAVALLERLGLLSRDADGTLRPAQRKVSTGGQVRSLAVRNFHRAMLGLAQRALDEVPRDHRNISGLTLPLDAAQYDEVCRRIGALRRELLQVADEASGETREIYQLTFALVPVTQPVPEG